MRPLERVDIPYHRLQRAALAAGLLGALLALMGLLISGPRLFFQAYLYAYLFWHSISLGALAIAMLHYLVGGGWGWMIRRVVEAAANSIWLLALLFIPIIAGLHFLYPWTDLQSSFQDPVLRHKLPYLNIPFFILRSVIYFAVWTGLARLLTGWSQRPDFVTDPELRRRLQRASAFGLILYALTMTFAAVDWLMSLEPHWYSTIYSMLVIMGQALSGLVFALALLPALARTRPLADIINPGHYRDLGAFLLAFVLLWAYLAFSQYLIIWSGNLPHEVTWYLNRSQGGWLPVGILIFIVQFGLPFLVLLSLRAKREGRILAGLSIAILFARLVDFFWHVKPAFYPQVLHIHWLDLALPVALGGLWAAAFLWHLARTPQPLLPESLQHGEHAPGLNQQRGMLDG